MNEETALSVLNRIRSIVDEPWDSSDQMDHIDSVLDLVKEDDETSTTRVVCAALRLPTGRKICGPRHFDPIMRSQIANDTEAPAWKFAEQGFVDQNGNWLTREDALKVATCSGQIRKRCGGDSRRLFSENLY